MIETKHICHVAVFRFERVCRAFVPRGKYFFGWFIGHCAEVDLVFSINPVLGVSFLLYEYFSIILALAATPRNFKSKPT